MNYEKLLQKLDTLKDLKNRTAIIVENVEQRLKEEFDCDSVTEAKEKLEALSKKIKEHEEKLDKLSEEFIREWDTVSGNYDD